MKKNLFILSFLSLLFIFVSCERNGNDVNIEEKKVENIKLRGIHDRINSIIALNNNRRDNHQLSLTKSKVSLFMQRFAIKSIY